MNKKNKKLNIIYFIDSEKTKSITLSFNIVQLILSAIALVAIWSVVSFGVIFWIYKESLDQKNLLKQAMNTVFDYQSRYDGVYELAYPGHKNLKNVKQSVDVAVIDKKEIEKENPEKIETKELDKAESKDDESESLKLDTVKAELPSDLIVQQAEVTGQNHKLELRFVMLNSNKDVRERGHVWAVSKIEKENGEIVYIPSPPHIKLDEKGFPTNKRNSHNYSVKNFKKTKLELVIPSQITGVIKEVDISTLDEKHVHKKFSFPMNHKIEKAISAVVPPQKAEASNEVINEKKIEEISKQTIEKEKIQSNNGIAQ